MTGPNACSVDVGRCSDPLRHGPSLHLLHHPSAVGLDGANARPERESDLLVLFTGDDKVEHLPLAWCQLGDAGTNAVQRDLLRVMLGGASSLLDGVKQFVGCYRHDQEGVGAMAYRRPRKDQSVALAA